MTVEELVRPRGRKPTIPEHQPKTAIDHLMRKSPSPVTLGLHLQTLFLPQGAGLHHLAPEAFDKIRGQVESG